jgi:predicted ATPase
MREARRVAAELDNPMTTGCVRAFDAILAALEPEGHDLDAAVAALDVSATMRLDYWAMVAELLRGWRDVRAGDLRGVVAIGRATRRIQAEQPLPLTLGLSLLARAHHQAGQLSVGRAVVTEALAWTERTGQRYLLPELLRIDAELLALSGDRAGARATVQRAVDTADLLESPWLRDRALATGVALEIGNA